MSDNKEEDEEDTDSNSSLGSLDLDLLHGLPWQYHPLRAFLLERLIANDIPADHKKMGPQFVWNKYCDEPCFEGMEYDAAFRRRLLALRKQFKEGSSRAEADLAAFKIAKKNHPPSPFNHRGEPQWNGSDAQRLLVIDMDGSKHIDYKPEMLWKSRPEYQAFNLSTFRDHIYQEDQTRKYLLTLRARSIEKEKKMKEKARKIGKKVREEIKKSQKRKTGQS